MNLEKNLPIQNRVFGLDLIRSLAILLVVSGHGNPFLENTFLQGFPYFKMIDGVDLFFVLSGFLIGGILLKDINSTNKYEVKNLIQFWKRRWLRTLPNYYLILLINYLIVNYKIIGGDINQFNWKFLFFLQNFSSPFYDFFWESWSLSIEEWFYVLYPILLFVFLFFFTSKKSFIIATIVMIAAPILCRILFLNPTIDDFWFDTIFRKIVILRLDSIAYGLFAAWIFYYYTTNWKKFKLLCLIIGISLIAFILNYDTPNTTFYKQVIYFTLSPIAAMLLLPFAEGIKTFKGIIGDIVAHISKISYSMYLINLAIVGHIIRDNFPPTDQLDGITKYILYWAIVIIGSTLLYKYFEKPIMNLRD